MWDTLRAAVRHRGTRSIQQAGTHSVMADDPGAVRGADRRDSGCTGRALWRRTPSSQTPESQPWSFPSAFLCSFYSTSLFGFPSPRPPPTSPPLFLPEPRETHAHPLVRWGLPEVCSTSPSPAGATVTCLV